VVAVGNLDKVWSLSADDVDEEEFRNNFKSHFGAKWSEILDTADKSFAYIACNDTYFAVMNLRLIANLTLLKLYRQKEIHPLNIIVS